MGVFALLLTGPPGAGKSTTLEALSDALHDDDIHHASLEMDAITWAHPNLATRQELRHLQAIGALYREEGYDLLLVSACVESLPERDALLAALDADDHFLVRLGAPEATLRERITAREPPGWSQLNDLLQRSRDKRTAMGALSGAHLVLDTGQLRRAEVAARIRGACPRLTRV